MSSEVIIFGAGKFGHIALNQYGVNNVKYFVDNNVSLIGKSIEGVPIKKVADAINDSERYKIIIASASYKSMEIQLKALGVRNYAIYKDESDRYYPTDMLVYNPYKDNAQRKLTEKDWIDNMGKNMTVQAINKQVELLYQDNKLFEHIEIETINRCNGNCDFCPVSKKNESRKYAVMERGLFENIIMQLAEIDYTGRLALFSNNEPFLDDDIIDKHRFARGKLPNAKMHLFTNGTLLSVEKFKAVIDYLDELIIDNYHKDLRLIKPCEEIRDYCEQHIELKNKVTIVLRNPHEILTTRGGDAPNRKEMVSYGKERCALPFKQLIIRPDGKVSLCCNDPLGKNTLGDLTKESVLDVWNNDKFKTVRKCLYEGRANWKHCEYCDAFYID
ncbi:radical SAM additional 4Fe4S-binding SPASM domain-containing protein [Lachnospiraceae bacterium A4]|nr:radical SAM additional 4Fe4S-binding SPASM domain-containing protein [Lachnospiraceae bacterium A4]